MMSVRAGLLSSVSNMMIRMLRSRLEHIMIGIMEEKPLPKLSLMTEDTIAKNGMYTSKMNLISLYTSLEVGLSASATKYRKVKKTKKVSIP